jgi:hypothetical protein
MIAGASPEIEARRDADAFVRRQIPIAMDTIAMVFPDQQLRTALFAQIGPSSGGGQSGEKSAPSPDAVKICECSSSTFLNECGGIYGAGIECQLQPWTECERQGTGWRSRAG